MKIVLKNYVKYLLLKYIDENNLILYKKFKF